MILAPTAIALGAWALFDPEPMPITATVVFDVKSEGIPDPNAEVGHCVHRIAMHRSRPGSSAVTARTALVTRLSNTCCSS